MDIQTTPIQDLYVFTPVLHEDARGSLYESFSQTRFEEATGLSVPFVQDNHTSSHLHVLRGMHYQTGTPQAKLVRVAYGSVFDVCVDLRRASPTYGQWYGTELSAANRKQMFIPQGFAHGFLTLSPESQIIYKLSELYDPARQHCLKWDDPAIAIKWPLTAPPLLSAKDEAGISFKDLSVFP